MIKRIVSTLIGLLGLLTISNVAGAAVRSDIIAQLEANPDGTTRVVIDGDRVNSTVRSGKIVLEAADPNCDPSVAPPCAYTLKLLVIRITNFDFDGEDVDNGLFVNTGLVTVFDNGGGIVIPRGTPFAFAVTVSGDRAGGTGSVASDVVVQMDLDAQLMTVTGAFQGSLEGFDVDATVAAQARSPFVNVPPSISIQETAEILECDPVPLLATVTDATSPPENGVSAPAWFVDGVSSGFGFSGGVLLTPGLHQIEAHAHDFFGALDTDSFVVNVLVDNVPPVFTFVPPDIKTSSCANLNIGTAIATDNCVDVEVTNDAPARFAAGTTVVTWTARDARGNTTTAQQIVVAELRNDPSCCPAGSNVMLGTSNNDVRTGTSGPDCILGFGGQDQLSGGDGNDVISGGDGDDVINAGNGNDLLYAGSGQDVVNAGEGNDLLLGDDGDDTLRGEGGIDTLMGGQGQDRLFGGASNDICLGNDGDDKMFGEDGDDVLDGGEHNDQCTGGAGFDTMLSCAAQDALDNPGPPSFPGDPNYDVCLCRPNKCTDCSSSATQCDAIAGCPQIIQCVQQAANCNLPHECSALCESGRTPQAINVARQLASCMGGC